MLIKSDYCTKPGYKYWWNGKQGTACPWLVPMGNGFWPIPFSIGMVAALAMKGKYDTTVAILLAGVLQLVACAAASVNGIMILRQTMSNSSYKDAGDGVQAMWGMATVSTLLLFVTTLVAVVIYSLDICCKKVCLDFNFRDAIFF